MNQNTGGWASRAALSIITRLFSTGTNASRPVVAILPPEDRETILQANLDAALIARGVGATIAQVPDGTATGGNQRGQRATDFQKSRSLATHVASGSQAGIVAGDRNCASGSSSFIGAGFLNTATGDSAVISGGAAHNATGTRSAIVGGAENRASGGWSLVGAGQNNTASANYSSVVGGFTNTASAVNSSIAGGVGNIADGVSSFVSGGSRGTTRLISGNHVFAACDSPISTTTGGTQSALLLLGRETLDATATVLTSNTSAASATNQVTLPNNSAYYFKGSVIAGVTGGGNSKAWSFEGAIKRGANAASTAIVGTVVLNTIAQDAGASAWTIAITADTTNGAIAVTVTGAASTTIRWMAKIETTEMTY
ncbi:hypothetical protein UFOVP383_20 [uncultured Caudovirales phage]|uniref:Uncharacterized protein n=1 Tax=uncultured Caudovirales phage TaxID=2100421 RepID=A0A6J7WZ66_9CAUD|nr:hypothetical protein UFOVP383_20 [uncultured Caudovirales phage]